MPAGFYSFANSLPCKELLNSPFAPLKYAGIIFMAKAAKAVWPVRPVFDCFRFRSFYLLLLDFTFELL
jgi:hypothetical protein